MRRQNIYVFYRACNLVIDPLIDWRPVSSIILSRAGPDLTVSALNLCEHLTLLAVEKSDLNLSSTGPFQFIARSASPLYKPCRIYTTFFSEIKERKKNYDILLYSLDWPLLKLCFSSNINFSKFTDHQTKCLID
jgi:hypothetical protein